MVVQGPVGGGVAQVGREAGGHGGGVQRGQEGGSSPGNGPNIPLSDGPLLDLLDALVEQRGKVAAAKALGVNYRTVTACYDSRRVSPRMRRG